MTKATVKLPMENMTDSLFIPYFRSFIFESRVTVRRHLHPHLYRKGSEVKSIRHHPHCHTARKAITSALIQICLPTRRIAPRRHHRSKWKPPPLFSLVAESCYPTHFQLQNHKPSFRPPPHPQTLLSCDLPFLGMLLLPFSISPSPPIPPCLWPSSQPQIQHQIGEL